MKIRSSHLLGIAIVAAAAITTTKILTGLPPEKHSIRVVNCIGYCNMPLFIAASDSANEKSKSALKIETVFVANPADHPAALNAPNGPVAAVTPFTTALIAFANGADIRIISGSGANGLALVGQSSFAGPVSLADQVIGTVSGDTLEQIAYTYVQKHPELRGRVKFRYFSDPIALIQALKNKEVAAITHVEPFVTRLVESDGMKLIARGEEVWGRTHPDCVLITTASAIRTRREDLKELISLLLDAEKKINSDMKAAVETVAEPVYQMKATDLLTAVKAQFPKIDIRDSEAFMMERSAALRDLGHIKSSPTASIFDFSMLKEVADSRK